MTKRALKALEDRIHEADLDRAAMARSLRELIKCYGESDGGGPIPIIQRAVDAARRWSPDFKFEDY